MQVFADLIQTTYSVSTGKQKKDINLIANSPLVSAAINLSF